jgi:hypothetical protein
MSVIFTCNVPFAAVDCLRMQYLEIYIHFAEFFLLTLLGIDFSLKNILESERTLKLMRPSFLKT